MVNVSFQMFFTALPLAFALLHLILYLYNKESKGNLYYAILLFLWAGGVFFDFQASLSDSAQVSLIFLRVHRLVMMLQAIAILRYVYVVFCENLPKQFWLLGGSTVIAGIVTLIDPVDFLPILSLATLVIVYECFRVVITCMGRKFPGAGLFLFALIALSLFSGYDLVLDLGVMAPIWNFDNAYFFGHIFFFVSMSIYLARDVAAKNRNLMEQILAAQEQDIRCEVLEVDNKRKTAEIEEARAIQLSMLPSEIPDYDGYTIAARMKTATEVGGDYYDFCKTDDGLLFIALGDATGHGMRAGIMVAVMKSLFSGIRGKNEPSQLLAKFDSTVEHMDLKRMNLAMSLLKIAGEKCQLAAAAMPPLLIYRHSIGKVEEIEHKSMMLGTSLKSEYQTVDFMLEKNDVLLLLTDGLPELADKNEESFGYQKVEEILLQYAERNPEEIVEQLFLAGDQWRDEIPQQDDITIIVLRKQ